MSELSAWSIKTREDSAHYCDPGPAQHAGMQAYQLSLLGSESDVPLRLVGLDSNYNFLLPSCKMTLARLDLATSAFIA